MIYSIFNRIKCNTCVLNVNLSEFEHLISFVDNLNLGTIRLERGQFSKSHIYIKYQYYDEEINQYVTFAQVIMHEDEKEDIPISNDKFFQDIEELPYY